MDFMPWIVFFVVANSSPQFKRFQTAVRVLLLIYWTFR